MSRTFKFIAKFPVPKWFKRMNRAEERAIQKMALRNCGELPIFKTRDRYEFW